MPSSTPALLLHDGTVTLRPRDGGAAHAFAVEHQGSVAGTISLTPDGEGGAVIAFELVPPARGRGLASRAVRLLVEWALTDGGYAVVHWRAHAGDFASRRVAWATGFTFSGTVPRLHRGELVDGWAGWTTADMPRRPATPWLEPVVLETERLRLRPWRLEDGPALVEASADAQLRHFLPRSPLPREAGEVAEYLDRVRLGAASGHRVAWCVADRETDAPLGNVAVFELDGPPERQEAQVGYWAHPRARGRGVMAEAVRRVADWSLAPDGLDVHRLYLLTSVSNTGSRRVAERAGFEHVGTERGNGPVGDGWEDSALYDRLRAG